MRSRVLGAVAGAAWLALSASPPWGDALAQSTATKPANGQAAKKDDPWPINDDVDDPAVWGKAFPLHYELYAKSVDMQRTKHGGSEANYARQGQLAVRDPNFIPTVAVVNIPPPAAAPAANK